MLTWCSKLGFFSQSESSILHAALSKFKLSAGVEDLNLVYLGGRMLT